MRFSFAAGATLLLPLAFLGAVTAFVSDAWVYHNNNCHRRGCLELCSVVSEAETASDEATPKRRFMVMTEEQDLELKAKGDREAELMSNKQSPLKATKVKGIGASGGFGTTSPNFKQQAKAYAKVLRKEGVLRIDNVLSPKLCDSLRDYLCDLRARATAEVESGAILDSQDRFADVLLNQNRCDLKIPLGPKVVHQALHHVLTKSPIRTLFEYVYDSYGGDGKDATIYELNCFMSNSGSRRQLVHFDTACTTGLQEEEPIMLTCFVSLQDIDSTMGPTAWIPRTHNVKSHNQFLATELSMDTDDDESPKERLLRTNKSVLGTLPKGACAVFDPRTLHCAGENTCPDPDNTRALFYFSFKNPRVDYPGSPSTGGYGISDAELTLEELSNELAVSVKAKEETGPTGSARLDAIACFP